MRRVHRHRDRFRSAPTGQWKSGLPHEDYPAPDPVEVVVPPFDLGSDDDETEEVPSVAPLGSMTLVQLRALASEWGVDLKGARTKAAMVEALER